MCFGNWIGLASWHPDNGRCVWLSGHGFPRHRALRRVWFVVLVWFHLEALQRSVVDASFWLLGFASWHLVGWRCFVNLPGLSALLRSGACTLALRACFGVVHLRAPSRCLGSAPWLMCCCSLLALASWLSVSSWQNQNIARSLKRLASWHLGGSRCLELAGALCADAGFLLMTSPPLPMVTSWRPGITRACRRRPWCLTRFWLPAGVASLPFYACRPLWHPVVCFRFGCGRF